MAMCTLPSQTCSNLLKNRPQLPSVTHPFVDIWLTVFGLAVVVEGFPAVWGTGCCK